MQKKEIVVNDVLVKYISLGEGDTTIIFLHGWRSNLGVWKNILTELKDNYKLLALDLPGFGDSLVPKRAFNTELYAEFIEAFLQKLGINNAIFVGHSFGGRIIINLAIKKSTFLKKLVLVNPSGIKLDSKFNLVGLFVVILRPVFKLSFLKSLRKKIYHFMGWEDYIADESAFYKDTYKNVLLDIYNDKIERIALPTLIISGERDKSSPPKTAIYLNQKIPNSKLQIIPNAGHFSFLDNPKLFKQLLIDFIVN